MASNQLADLNFKLRSAADDGDTHRVACLVHQRADVNTFDLFGVTPLHMAAYHGHADTAKFLLAHGADVNGNDEDVDTPHHYACLGASDLTVTKLLCERRGSTETKNAAGGTRRSGCKYQQEGYRR